ncbi:MAG: N-acetylmuramoyl-L-alanine amidase [Clostridia bacterium]|nr:N-acetylmuramoyl-L-alanine amidase [Clostridia bacterium]
MPTSNRALSSRWLTLLFLAFTLALCAAGLLLGGMTWASDGISPHAKEASALPEEGEADTTAPIRCVVIDAGHGGEDGGTISATGLCEKNVNLSIALYLRDILEAAGVPTVMTRTEDILLYDRTIDYHGRKKVLDLAARLAIGEATEASLFVSIHQNAFPATQYAGLQVWYGIADPRSKTIAAAMQEAGLLLDPENRRQIKPAGSNIYLLDRLKTPAVLVECGFLSNPEEASRLGDATYQRSLALLLASTILPHITTG